ncbi:MAG: GH116 family glycosyl hydrolase, partial [Candidatus Aminicenantales bacterium]
RRPVMVSIALSMMNPIRTLDKAGRRGFGHNINHYINEGFFQGIYMLSLRGKEKDIGKGTIAFITPEKDVDVQTRWYRGGWWDNAHLFWDDFSRDGRLVPCTDSVPAPEGRTDVASLLVHCQLKPGEEKVVPFYLTWHFPWRENYWNREKEVKGKVFRNYYATKFKDALHVARFVVGNLETLYQDTKAFHDLLFSSTYPSYAIEAVSSQASSLKTNLVMQTEDGKFFGFEGLSDDRGCCPMNCTHVWNYEQTLAFLFPSLERTMRETDFMHNTFENGYQVFRTLVPLGDYWWTYKPCADGQMGNIVRVYREWKMSGDSEWLAKLWPRVKAALEFAWNGVGEVNSSFSWQKERLKLPWDPDRDGCMEGEQHNTYDIEFYGPNTMTGSLYLAALKACAEMAEAMGEPETARRYRNIFEQGSEEYDRTLWNGEYYIQKIDVMDGLVIPQHLRSPERDSEEISGRSSRFAEGKEEREEAVSSFCLF